MHAWLELRIPPPLVMLIVALIMFLLAIVIPLNIELPLRLIGVTLFVLAGSGVALAGVISFYLNKTTVNPLQPNKASTLVIAGIYKISRNPMYLGMFLALCAWTIYLANPVTLAGLPIFILYMNQYQIKPEERALQAKFGDEYQAYMQQVRRWC